MWRKQGSCANKARAQTVKKLIFAHVRKNSCAHCAQGDRASWPGRRPPANLFLSGVILQHWKIYVRTCAQAALSVGNNICARELRTCEQIAHRKHASAHMRTFQICAHAQVSANPTQAKTPLFTRFFSKFWSLRHKSNYYRGRQSRLKSEATRRFYDKKPLLSGERVAKNATFVFKTQLPIAIVKKVTQHFFKKCKKWLFFYLRLLSWKYDNI